MSYETNQLTHDLPPCDLNSEEELLGGILCSPQIFSVVKHLETEVFLMTSHQALWRCFLELDKAGKEPNLGNVRAWLTEKNKLEKIGGLAKLAQLAQRISVPEAVPDYANILLDKWFRRRLAGLGQKLAESGHTSPASTESLFKSLEEEFECLKHSPALADKPDPDYSQYQRLIEQVRRCEVEIYDPGFKAYTMQKIAKEYGRTPKQIEDIYFKHLIHTEQEPLMSLSELIEKYGSEVREWLLHGFIPKGSTILLHAPGGKGKTRLAYNFFYHLATGSDWDGYPVTAPKRKCMIIQTDEPGFDMVQAVKDRGFNEDMPVLYRTKWQTDHMAYLREEVAEHRPDIVLIDSLSSINRNSLFTENDAEYARPILLLRDIAQEFNCTFMLIHHSNKSGDARGTGAIFNSVSEVWKLESDPDSEEIDSCGRLFSIEKSRSRRPATYKLEFNPEDKSWQCLGEAHHFKERVENKELDSRLICRDQILSFLASNAPTRYETEELSHELNRSLASIRRACGELVADGMVASDISAADPRKQKKCYWVQKEGGDRQGDRQPPADQQAIGKRSAKRSAKEPPNNGASGIADQLEAADQQFLQQTADQQKSKIGDRHDQQGGDDSQTPSNDGASAGDQFADQFADQQAIGSRSADQQSETDQQSLKAKVGDRVKIKEGWGEVTQANHKTKMYKIKLDSGEHFWYTGKILEIDRPADTTQPDQSTIREQLIELLKERDSIEEVEAACLFGLSLPTARAALAEIGYKISESIKGSFWALKAELAL